jgi:hypothetical protein
MPLTSMNVQMEARAAFEALYGPMIEAQTGTDRALYLARMAAFLMGWDAAVRHKEQSHD